MADVLKAKGWSVVYVENYRVNGQVNWRVAKTQFSGKNADNDQTKTITNEIGVPYIKAPQNTKFPGRSNLIIILGRDYANLPVFK